MFVVSEALFVSILLRGLWLGLLPEDGKMGNRCKGSNVSLYVGEGPGVDNALSFKQV
ncbi:hypothetical protein K0M31_007921 [Melipona bicolor]|uniref:Uncharacterized protein n=1 Tax=Melipona bicolor TaxID=60889 RepID=A0AA40KW69_9HYME|nr:hypothetical protein K0M31_007921 [Melipona bicolor]